MLDAGFLTVLHIALVISHPALGAFRGKIRSILQTRQSVLAPQKVFASALCHYVRQCFGGFMVNLYVIHVGTMSTVTAVHYFLIVPTNLIGGVQVQCRWRCRPHATFGLFANDQENWQCNQDQNCHRSYSAYNDAYQKSTL
jgi:hypothetical protein